MKLRRFADIVQLALNHHTKGEMDAALAAMRSKSRKTIASIPDDRVLAMMARKIFYAGFNQRVIDQKWPAFEEAFAGFAPAKCAALGEEDIEHLMRNRAIVRNGPKIESVAINARFVRELSRKHGSAAAFFADWPNETYVDLLQFLKKSASRLGGDTGARFLRELGKPAFVLTKDVVAALVREKVVAAAPTSKSQMAAVQAAMNAWSAESKLDLTQLSRYLAWSVD